MWLAGDQHGFAMLAGIPELQQIIAYTCMDVLHEFGCAPEQYVAPQPANKREDYSLQNNVCRQSLLYSLTPQLRVCLLAEVAAGLMCPG